MIDEISNEIEKIKEKYRQKKSTPIGGKFQQVKQKLENETFGWDLEQTEKEIQSLVVQKQNISDENGQIQLDIIEYKLDVLQRHQSSLNGIQVETALQRAQEDLDAARL